MKIQQQHPKYSNYFISFTKIFFISLLLISCNINSVQLQLRLNNNNNNNKYYKAARLTSDFAFNVPTLSSSSSSSPSEVVTEVAATTINSLANEDALSVENDSKINDTLKDLLPIGSNQTNTINATTQFVETSNLLNNNAENRLRWVDFNRHQFLPRVPNIPGIPSGFRNPLATPSQTPQQSVVLLSSTTSTPTPMPTIFTTTEATIEPIGALYNPGANHNFMATSSSNPVGFAGSPLMDDNDLFFNVPTNSLRRFNITRVEHIVAECSEEYMKVVIRFNGTFNGLIYSSGYVHDPNCIYVNGSGRSHYEFFIRLNQCGTLGRQEMYHPSMPGEARRRDQLMWNTLSIQYNPLIEEEFDEHFRLTCEYGSDFWKTVSFPAVNVEINTGSPVVFSINPPQCQMEIRRGFGIAGTRTSGPVTVGDPLTLLIHMKSEKVGFDILVKNCVAHNGAQQRMQLIDSNGCVTNDKLISPFRGTYNADNGHQVSLFAYLKAFRFTGSLALYLECDIHMCHNRCPPQRCYWRNLSKRSAKLQSFDETINSTANPILSESISLSQALEVHHEQDEEITPTSTTSSELRKNERSNNNDDVLCLRSGGLITMIIFIVSLMSISLGTSICYCHRMRKLRFIQRNLNIAQHYQQESKLHDHQYNPSPSIYGSSASSIRSYSECNNSTITTKSPIQYPYRNSRFFRFY